jgi:hypothetical protein
MQREHAQRSDHSGHSKEDADVAASLRCGPPHFNKTLWRIIDALRFDFLLYVPAAAAESISDGDVGLRTAPTPSSIPPPLPPHVQRMPELLSLGRDWVRTDAA